MPTPLERIASLAKQAGIPATLRYVLRGERTEGVLYLEEEGRSVELSERMARRLFGSSMGALKP
ncbi:MAG TPA: hypothetical protein VLV83_08850 [Acidobacteriota bacterium]|nr:hypothetical protein [Acidobacteriota bacterium]